jgi:hypothetical protein
MKRTISVAGSLAVRLSVVDVATFGNGTAKGI